jgi:hypothetical protein
MERSEPIAERVDLPEPENAVEAEGTLDLAAVRKEIESLDVLTDPTLRAILALC